MLSPLVQPNLDKQSRGYLPSFFAGDHVARISEAHDACERTLADIRGKLEPADYLKLYECAFYATGPILEIGRLHGKSTAVLALGSQEAGHSHRITSVDLEERYSGAARDNLRRHGIPDERVQLLVGDSATVVRTLPERYFHIVFVDGDHSYDGVRRDLEAVSRVHAIGAVVLFHDYYHGANETGEYGVRRAVDELAVAFGLQFCGRYGGISMFKHRT